jgi:hypothetical protein
MTHSMLIHPPDEYFSFDKVRMLKYSEAAELLKVDRRTVHRRVTAGRYIAYGNGSGKRILLKSIIDDIQRSSDEIE